MCFEGFAPGGAGIGEEDVDVVGAFGDFGDEALDFGDLGGVRRHGYSKRVGLLVGECIEGFDCFVASGGFAGGDIDTVSAGLEQTGWKLIH